MNRLAASTLILVLAAGGVALADSPYRGGGDRHGWNDGRDSRAAHVWRDGRDHRIERNRHDRHDRYDRHDRRDGRWGYHGYSGPRGYDHHWRGYGTHRWARGHWLPVEYRARHYHVPDYWRYGHRVYAPPRGCGWVRYNGDLILTALATGLVLDVIYDAY
jgi:Ni/Co efflux regulator RcnB